ncbi:hypothetical protein ElyMa_001830900 [Elysia marginata]|uniref:PiggyBac transposable element-derived protein domain-containing protein n=1 Tax=Elysia marginata TaxID=1093978 RepID=A0AAV4EID9_9GAST|nr:hypothetical protein ElyMa_001830900 [Elysia marginata]
MRSPFQSLRTVRHNKARLRKVRVPPGYHSNASDHSYVMIMMDETLAFQVWPVGVTTVKTSLFLSHVQIRNIRDHALSVRSGGRSP